MRRYLLIIGLLFNVAFGQSLFGVVATDGQKLDPDAKIFIDSVQVYVSLSDAQKKAIDTLFRDLKGKSNPRYSTGNIWDSVVTFYPLIGANANAHKFNGKAPVSYQLTYVNSPTHNSTGITFNGTTQYANTNFNPDNPPLTSTSRQGMSIYAQNAFSGCAVGLWDGSSRFWQIFNVGGIFGLAGGSSSASGSASSSGMWSVLSFSSRTVNWLFKNKTLDAAGGSGGNNYYNQPIWLAVRNQAGSPANYSNIQLSFYSFHTFVGATSQEYFYNAVQGFQQRLSRAASGSVNVF